MRSKYVPLLNLSIDPGLTGSSDSIGPQIRLRIVDECRRFHCVSTIGHR